MTQDAYLIIRTTFSSIWTLFTGWHIPGTNVSPGAWFLFLVAAGIGLRSLKRIISREIGEDHSGKKGDKQ